MRIKLSCCSVIFFFFSRPRHPKIKCRLRNVVVQNNPRNPKEMSGFLPPTQEPLLHPKNPSPKKKSADSDWRPQFRILLFFFVGNRWMCCSIFCALFESDLIDALSVEVAIKHFTTLLLSVSATKKNLEAIKKSDHRSRDYG